MDRVVDGPGSHVEHQFVAPVAEDVVLAEPATRCLDLPLHKSGCRMVACRPFQSQNPDGTKGSAFLTPLSRTATGQRRGLLRGILGPDVLSGTFSWC